MACSTLSILALLSTIFSETVAYTYVGCYTDKSSRALSVDKGRSYTVATCANACSDYKYFAVQDNDECYCSTSYKKSTKYGASTACSASGTGAAWANSLYYNKGDTGGIPFGYVGCFEDQENRAVSDLYKGDGYSVGGCSRACRSYNYFAVQNGDECRCDNDYAQSVRYGESDGCASIGTYPERTYGTGGAWANSLYIQNPRFEYIACYEDTSDRAVNDLYVGKGYTPYTCSEACTNYEYFAVQNGNECYCDDTLSEATQYGTSKDCNFFTGAGGYWANSLYTHQIGTIYDDVLGEWELVAGGGGGAALTYSISVGLSNYHSSEMSVSNTRSFESSVTAGIDFVGSAEVTLTASQSRAVSGSIITAAEQSQTETVTIECPAGDQALYQFVATATEQDQNNPSQSFGIDTKKTWCISSADIAPQCPFEYCADDDCQTCSVVLGQDSPFVILFNHFSHTVVFGVLLGLIVLNIIGTVWLLRSNTNCCKVARKEVEVYDSKQEI